MESYDHVKLITYHGQFSSIHAEVCIPISNKSIFNFEEIEPWINWQNHHNRILFIVLIRHSDPEKLNKDILDRLISHPRICSILIYKDVMKNFSIKSEKIFYVCQQSITNQVTLRAMLAYKLLSKESGNAIEAQVYMTKAEKLHKLFWANLEIIRCHIFIHPINGDYWNTINCQSNLIQRCELLYPNKKLVVSTLFDYITPDFIECMDENNQLGELICRSIIHMIMIRIGAVANTDSVHENWCSAILGSERNQADPFPTQNTVFLKTENITVDTEKKVLLKLQRWNPMNTKLYTIDDIMNDNNFDNAIVYVDDIFNEHGQKQTFNALACHLQVASKEFERCFSAKLHQIQQAKDKSLNETNSSDDEINTLLQTNDHNAS